MKKKSLVVLPVLLSPFFFAATLFHNDGGLTARPNMEAGPEENYRNYCASCHGEKMDAFADRSWKHGSSRDDLFKSIKKGWPDEGMPSFDSTFTDKEVYALADYILKGIKNVDRYKGGDKPKSATFKTEALTIKLDTVVKGLDIPWGMAFLPKGAMLVTDRNGKLYHVAAEGRRSEVSGVPEVLNRGQGGLMDVAVDPAFASNGFIYLSYSKYKKEGGATLATTAVLKAKLSGNQLSSQQDIFVAKPYSRTQHHYGSRLQFGKDGLLYISVGERGNEKENPQQIKGNDLGKIHRIKADGTVPADNPFVKTEGAGATIWSYGHRNPQGMAIDPATGQLWENEHGPRGGDEINIIKKGRNYGWPVVTYGINYNGKIISDLSKKPGIEDAVHFWLPSIGVSGMTFVNSDKYPGWKGNILSGSLRFQYLNRSVLKNNKVVHEEILFRNIGRLRDVRVGPDGFIYIAVESPGTVYRLVPVKK
ncbi:PQQ-dependent sugar dehydrogenase [Pedobacter sp. SYP-B3415]|uniref:PQQ-dependent sugar dehydrogenase n=1 Tax=Pedobacter sp. SYP-B3415 TaxID=2496641 RepID=UPI00101B7B07|nr:PQQ-dependent sugar dehydrogenase [Pedobacter sp. SYP-B3415]